MHLQQPARRSCGVQIEHRRLLNQDPEYARRRAEIENLARAYRLGLRRPTRTGVIRVPVAVHVVWNTPEQNISDGQIHSQIDVLNQDYRKTNPDIAQIPPVWSSVASDARVEFVLASTGPDGQPTSGITRTQTATQAFTVESNAVKSTAHGGADPWPSDKYLNIWVCQLDGGLLGYSEFPGAPADIDGVVILHSAFGTTGTATAPFNVGRTATHEVGHWLGLFHIWGDDGTGCNGTDQVDDTPNQAGPNYGTPTFPSISCDNGPNGDMFVNYMDYTDDAVMHMFTQGQVLRMQASLDGPRSQLGTTAPPTPQAAKVASGKTNPGQTDWRSYSVNNTVYGIFVDVDTSTAAFTRTPVYVTSIGGNGYHWSTTGGSSVYQPTATGFRIYIRWSAPVSTVPIPDPPTPEFANAQGWHINWIGSEV
jgi:Pregnancy-associated plasma protein-A